MTYLVWQGPKQRLPPHSFPTWHVVAGMACLRPATLRYSRGQHYGLSILPSQTSGPSLASSIKRQNRLVEEFCGWMTTLSNGPPHSISSSSAAAAEAESYENIDNALTRG